MCTVLLPPGVSPIGVNKYIMYVASFFRDGPRNAHRSSYKAVCKIVISIWALKGRNIFSTTSKRQILLITFGQTDKAAVIVVLRDSQRAENNDICLKEGFIKGQVDGIDVDRIIYIYIYIYIYIQGITGGKGQTSGGCSLC